MKSSKHVETCFVRANDDFDDKSTYIYCFLNKKKIIGQKSPKTDTVAMSKYLQLKGIHYCPLMQVFIHAIFNMILYIIYIYCTNI